MRIDIKKYPYWCSAGKTDYFIKTGRCEKPRKGDYYLMAWAVYQAQEDMEGIYNIMEKLEED